MFNQKIDKQILLQYVLLVSFCLGFIFAPLGDITIDFGDVYYVLPPESGYYNDSVGNVSLSLGIKGNLIICALAVLEGIMITLSKKGVFTGVWICLSRQLYLVCIMLLNIVSAMADFEFLVVDFTVFSYILIILGVISFINNLSIRKKKRLMNNQNIADSICD